MNKINYDQTFCELVKNFMDRPKLLLHSCCAPCSSAVIERIKDIFDLTVYYYNPNIDTDEEYQKRRQEQIALCNKLGVAVISEEHDARDFLTAVKGFEDQIEGGARCDICFYLRLKKTAEKAEEIGAKYFMTTLTVSPKKNAKKVNDAGERASGKVEYIPSDFKKKEGYKRSIELSKRYGLYRQNYCGCKFSKGEK